MENKKKLGVSVEEINKDKCYFNPGCSFEISKNNSYEKVIKLLTEHYGPVKSHLICCKYDPKVEEGATIINNCAGCDMRFNSLYEGVNSISIWEVLDSIESLPLPKYENLSVSIQDPCKFRQQPKVLASVRSLLKKMNINIIEAERSGQKGICCGGSLYSVLDFDKFTAHQKNRASQMPCEDVVVYCGTCIKSIAIGGKTPRHMIDLIFNEETLVTDGNFHDFKECLAKYIDVHQE